MRSIENRPWCVILSARSSLAPPLTSGSPARSWTGRSAPPCSMSFINRLAEAEPLMRRALEIFMVSLGGVSSELAGRFGELRDPFESDGEGVGRACSSTFLRSGSPRRFASLPGNAKLLIVELSCGLRLFLLRAAPWTAERGTKLRFGRSVALWQNPGLQRPEIVGLIGSRASSRPSVPNKAELRASLRSPKRFA